MNMKDSLPQALFFDFDGVLVDSNTIKIEAFYDLFEGYDDIVVEQVIAYHRQHGGISRVVKIQHAFEQFIGLPLSAQQLDQMAHTYSNLVVEKVIAANWIKGAKETLETLLGKLLIFVISGTPQNELRLVVERRGMSHYFDEVLGSPIKKPEHIQNLCKQYAIVPEQCVFIGDAFTDLDAAEVSGMPFIGIQGEITFPEKVKVLPDCSMLIELINGTYQL